MNFIPVRFTVCARSPRGLCRPRPKRQTSGPFNIFQRARSTEPSEISAWKTARQRSPAAHSFEYRLTRCTRGIERNYLSIRCRNHRINIIRRSERATPSGIDKEISLRGEGDRGRVSVYNKRALTGSKRQSNLSSRRKENERLRSPSRVRFERCGGRKLSSDQVLLVQFRSVAIDLERACTPAPSSRGSMKLECQTHSPYPGWQPNTPKVSLVTL